MHELPSLPASSQSQQKTLTILVDILESCGCTNITGFDLRNSNYFTEYCYLASTQSSRQIRAVCEKIHMEIKNNLLPHGLIDDDPHQSGWAVVDFFDFVVHIQSEQNRVLYNLEGLWKTIQQSAHSP